MTTNFLKIIINGLLLLFINYTFSQAKSVEPYQFAWLSDIHIVQSGTASVKELKTSIAKINKNKAIKFTIISGDIADFAADSTLQLAKGILDSLKMPYYVVPGNHDTKWSESGNTSFSKIFGHRNISFVYGNIRFVGFQTGDILRRANGYIDPQDFKWVKKELRKAKKRGQIIIPFTHFPLIKQMMNGHKLAKLFRKYKVPMVLSGHLHRYDFFEAGGIPNMVSTRNITRAKVPGGYTTVKVTADSMAFYKNFPSTGKKIPWKTLSYQPIDYSKKGIKPYEPDFSINDKYDFVQAKWKKELDAGISSGATISDNKVFVGDREGILYSLSVNTGKEKWRFKTGDAIFSQPAFRKGQVVFGSTDGYIYNLDGHSGKLNWKFKTNNYVLGAPTIEDGVIYIGSSDRKFRALDLQTGRLKWVFEGLKAWVQTKPVIYKDKIFFGAWDNYFYALNKKNGRLVWKWTRSTEDRYPNAFYAPAASQPVAAHHRVFFTRPDLVLTALNADTGKVVWEIGNPRLNEAIGISQDSSRVFVKTTRDESLLAYSTTSVKSKLLWETEVDYGFDDNESPVNAMGGVAYYALLNGEVIAVNSENGELLWRHKLGEIMANEVTPVEKGKIIVSDIDGKIRLLENKKFKD